MSLASFGVFLVLFLYTFLSLHCAAPPAVAAKKQTKRQSRILNGNQVAPHSYPSIVLMNIKGNPECAGTILHSEWVLSAAHCITTSYEPRDYTFLAGKQDKSKVEPNQQNVTCVEVVAHENYLFGDDDNQKNDIAMFKVSPPFKFNDKVRPTVLPYKDWDRIGPSIPVGWGKIGEGIHDPSADILQETSVPVIHNKDCAKIMAEIFDTSLCASSEGGKDACQGDSGGPLYFKEGLNTIQIGIVSWGDGCGQTGKAGVYTRVNKYIDWIHGNLIRDQRPKHYPKDIGRGLQVAPVNVTAAPVGRGVLKAPPSADKGKSSSRIIKPATNEAPVSGKADARPPESPANTNSKKATSLNPVAGKTSRRKARILGGHPVTPHSYPSIVLMNIYGEPGCAGTILHSEWVLSAAHCTISDDPSDYTFLAGKHDKSKVEPDQQNVTCVKVVVHEDYQFGEEYDQKNDIALFKVSPPFKYNDKVMAVKLPTFAWDRTGPAIPVGWGKIGEKANDSTADILQETSVPVISNEDCAKMMPDVFNTSLCASSEGGRDACQGDSGGPLFFKYGSDILQIGIVSWGDGCGHTGRAGVYTRVNKYLDWIKGKLFMEGVSKLIYQRRGGKGVQMTPVNVTAAPFGRGVLKAPSADKGKMSGIIKPTTNEWITAWTTDARPHEYPSVVLIKIYDEPGCTGTIYNSEWVISAGHCVISLNPSDYTFFAGKHDKDREEDSQQKVTAVQIVRHEGFDMETLANDILLFRVSPPFDLTEHVQVVELASKSWNKEGNAVSVGWTRFVDHDNASSILQQVTLPIVSNDDCSKIMDHVHDTSICAGHLQGKKDTCQGDSGGPLFYITIKKAVQIGIVSRGAGCTTKGNLGVYTRVSKYISWIRRTTSSKAKKVKTAIVFKRRDKEAKNGPVPLTDAQIEEKTDLFPRLVGGKETKKHEFSSVVLIVYNGRPICTGTIIHSKWVLSAAHCVLGSSPSSFVLFAGKHDKYADEDMEQNVTAILIAKHAAYSNNPFNNDIALVKVSPPFKLNNYVRPAKLPKPDMAPIGMSTVVGWDATNQSAGEPANLQKAQVPLITNDECKKEYGKGQIFPGSLCAGYNMGRRFGCQGDSGGPLFYMNGRNQLLIGVMSWGKGCAKKRYPGVYTRVTDYLAWIDEHTGLKSSKVRGK